MTSDVGGLSFSVAIPGSLVADTPHLREKTAKLGTVARACAIFGVREIILYQEDARRDRPEDSALCAELLKFTETPQYLRKRLFKLSPSLKFAGILPPLQIPSHDIPRSIRECRKGDLREGVVVAQRGESLDVDVGLERTIRCRGQVRVGMRITVRLTTIEKTLIGEIMDASKTSISRYWGYNVSQSPSLGKLLHEQRFRLRIGTSRYGVPIQEVLPSLSKALRASPSTLIAFGSPKMGLSAILAQEKLHPEDVFHYFVNTVPDQQTVTVRTEEALPISLGILTLSGKLPA